MVQSAAMRASITIDRDLAKVLERAQSLTREKKATLIRHAIRAGLSAVVNRFQSPRPEGCFTEDHAKADPERVRLENAHGKGVLQRPER